MKEQVEFDPRQQTVVNAYFDTQSSFWQTIYARGDVYAQIHQERHDAILHSVEALALARDAQVLEIGCGAGLMSVALSRRGLCVRAVDSASAMVEQTRRRAQELGVGDHMSVGLADIHALPFTDASFDLVIAVGVIPWVERPVQALAEVARVARPGGFVVFTADNRARMTNLLDPWMNPLVAPLKRRVKAALVRRGWRRQSLHDVGATSHARRFIDQTLVRVGLVKLSGKTLGFGPWTLMRRSILPERWGMAIHRRLQRLADQDMPILRSTGAHYLVVARKQPSS